MDRSKETFYDSNTTTPHKSTKVGVTPSYTSAKTFFNNSTNCTTEKWYLMRVSYGREKKVFEHLDGLGIQVFYPTYPKIYIRNGKKIKTISSLIPNTLFVYSTENKLRQFIGKPPIPYFHHYYNQTNNELGKKRIPIVVPDKQMEDFIKWCDVDDNDKIYRSTYFNFKKNDIVLVTCGPFKGFKGCVVRIKWQTRIGVNIDNIGFVCTSYIPKAFLEKI